MGQAFLDIEYLAGYQIQYSTVYPDIIEIRVAEYVYLHGNLSVCSTLVMTFILTSFLIIGGFFDVLTV